MDKQLQEISKIYQQFYEEVSFTEIEHIPAELAEQKFQILEGECLAISYAVFEKYYPLLMKLISESPSSLQTESEHGKRKEEMQIKAADILLSLNGENEKAWNLKKRFLNGDRLNLERELKFNSAICLKFKKSTNYFEYRLFLIRKQLSLLKEDSLKLIDILKRENDLMIRVLGRFYRNYYCWMYRVKFLDLTLEYLEKRKLENRQKVEELENQFMSLEVRMVEKFLDKNMNDYSGYSYLINLRKKTQNFCLQERMDWAQESLKFAVVAYEKEESYRNLIMYIGVLKQK